MKPLTLAKVKYKLGAFVGEKFVSLELKVGKKIKFLVWHKNGGSNM